MNQDDTISNQGRSSRVDQKPLWLEMVKPGMQLRLPHIDCTAQLVAGYAELLDAKHPIHVDAEYAKRSRFGRLVVHGPLIVAKSLAMMGEVIGESILAMLDVGDWCFYSPVFVGDMVRLECFVLDVSSSKGSSSGVVRLEIRVIAEGGGLAQRGTARVLMTRKSKI